MDEDLRNLQRVLRARAEEVPYLQAVPPAMLARARRRILRNALSSALAIGLVVAGASAGLAGLGLGRSHQTPGHSHGTHSPAPSSATACAVADLHATTALEGGAGSVFGAIDLTNAGARTCTLTGRPSVTLTSVAGDQLSVRVVNVAPQWEVDGKSRPDGWPIVRLRPGSVGRIRVRWSNGCPQLTAPAYWRVDLGGGRGVVRVADPHRTAPPPCNGPTQPSTLEVGPFEPGTA